MLNQSCGRSFLGHLHQTLRKTQPIGSPIQWVGCVIVYCLFVSPLLAQHRNVSTNAPILSSPVSPSDSVNHSNVTAAVKHPLKRGVNFGNMLEAPSEGAWGLTVKSEFFEQAAQAGFDHVRLPVSWTHHTSKESPFTIEPAFIERVDWCLAEAERVGLNLILNVHHYEELNRDPMGERARALAIWKQISVRYKDCGEWLFFEILNEPHVTFNDRPELWNQFMRDALAVIRENHPRRPVLVGPVRWNSIDALQSTDFDPPADPHLIAAVHYYEPFHFTHQGANWVDPSPPLGRSWDGNRLNFHSKWQNWSWEIQSDSVSVEDQQGMQITPQKGWAGLKLHHSPGIDNARRLRVKIAGGKRLKVAVFSGEKEKSEIVDFENAPMEFKLEINEGFGPVTDVLIQCDTEEVYPPFLLKQLELEHEMGVVHILQSETDEIEAAMSSAVAWAAERKMGLHLGEFGAYYRADLNSRSKWTRTVRELAEKNGIGWAYWEFASGFGVFDPEAGQFRKPLLDALLGK